MRLEDLLKMRLKSLHSLEPEIKRVLIICNMCQAVECPSESRMWTVAARSIPNVAYCISDEKLSDVLQKLQELINFINATLSFTPESDELPTSYGTQAWPYVIALRSRASVSQTQSVEVRTSLIHGKGVFALRDLKRNELVTTYPVHGLRVKMDQLSVGHEDRAAGKAMFCYFYDDGTEGNHAEQRWDGYKVNLVTGVDFYGDPLRHTCEACGHMINDSRGSGLVPNCMICPLFDGVANVICITNPIKSGHELLLDYGDAYWEGR